MALPPRELVMDNEIRPYFIHHRNQAGINASLMDLFHLIDVFLREDEDAREPLRALQLFSDYLQRRGIVAPMPSEPVDFYDPSRKFSEHNDPLAELSQLLTSVRGFTRTASNDQPHSPHIPSTIPISKDYKPPTGVHDSMVDNSRLSPSISRPSRMDLAMAFGDTPIAQSQTLMPHDASRMTATDHRSALVIQVVRERLRSWLRRPDISALKRWILKKCQIYPADDASWEFVRSPYSNPVDQWPEDGGQEVPKTDPDPLSTLDPTPESLQYGGIQVTKDTIMYRDSLPPTRKRALSVSMSRPLPPLPGQDQAQTSKNSPGVDGHVANSHLDEGASRPRRNSAASSYTRHGSNGPLPDRDVKPSPGEGPPRYQQASLKERAISALFSKRSESSSTDTSFQAHLNARVYQAKVMTPSTWQRKSSNLKYPDVPFPRTTSPRIVRNPSQDQHLPPPNTPKEVGKEPYIPNIVIQPPSIPGTTSTTSIPSPYHDSPKSISGYDGTNEFQLIGSKHTTVYAFPNTRSRGSTDAHKEPQKAPNRTSNSSSRTTRPHVVPVEEDVLNHVREYSSPQGGMPPLGEEASKSPSSRSIHHGLPTPKSVQNRAMISPKSPLVSLCESPTTSCFDPTVDPSLLQPEENSPPPLASRFSLDSDFTVSTVSVDGRSASPDSGHYTSSSSEAVSREGAFLARLASKRKAPIRSGASRLSVGTISPRASYRQMEDHSLASKTPKLRERPARINLRSESSPRLDQGVHRRVLSH